MSFLKSLFGGGKSARQAVSAGPVASAEHDGFLIEATPIEEGGAFLVCGVISKTVEGERREHRFIRADRCPSPDTAAEMTLRKGRQIIEQMGERVFDQTGG